jgi:alkylation response protein AidB-like acyl-CoA dehydrogenase
MDRFTLRRQDYSLDEDQEAVRDAFSAFFADKSPSSVVRAAEPLGYDEQLWRDLNAMGVSSMGLPAAAGGDDATLVDLVLIAEEVGRSVAPVPFIGHVAATRLLAAAGADQALIDEAVNAEPPFALALQPVNGTNRQLVPDAAVAHEVIALADGDLVLFRRDKPSEHVHNQGSSPLGWWAPGTETERIVLATGDAAVKLHERAVDEWKLMTAAALIGMTESALHHAVEFAKTRETMGVPIGSLQGVAFPLADVAIGTAGGRNLIWRASWMADNLPGERPELTGMAFAYAAQVATHGTTTSAHMQGGLGFTIEADASLYFLRAKGWSVLAGDPRSEFVRIGGQLVAAAGE